MSEIMLWLSGVDREVLSHCEGERNKFVAMGGTVLTTAVLATCAATFTSHRFLHAPLFFAFMIGIGWGFAIMNLDRWLLISIRRQETPGKTIAMAVPRVVLALLVGAVIAHPLVLRIFEGEVSARARHNNREARAENRRNIRQQFVSIPVVAKELSQLQTEEKQVGDGAEVEESPEYQRVTGELGKLERQSTKTQQEAYCADCGTGKPGAEEVFDKKQERADEFAAQLAQKKEEAASVLNRLREREANHATSTRSQLHRKAETAENKLRRLKIKRTEAFQEVKEQFAQIGLLDRVEALDELTTEKPALLVIEVLIFLFILAVDSVPAIAKVLMSLGVPSPYEVAQTKLDEINAVRLEQQVRAHATASEKEAEAVIDEAATRKALMKEAQSELIQRSVDAMKEAGEKFVELWREEILRRVPGLVDREMDRYDPGNGKSGGPAPPSGNGSNGTGEGTVPEAGEG